VVGEYGCWRNSTHLFLQGDGSLDDGACIELTTMAPVPNTDCRKGYHDAVHTEEVSSLVLEYDLQRAIHQELIGELAYISHQVSSRGRRGAVHSGVFDPRGAERVLTVRRAPRGEKTPLGAVHRHPQQKVGEICRLGPGR